VNRIDKPRSLVAQGDGEIEGARDDARVCSARRSCSTLQHAIDHWLFQASSIVTKGDSWIEARGAARGNPARNESHREQQGRTSAECDGVVRLNPVQKGGQHAHQEHRGNEAESESHGGKPQRFSQDRSRHLRRRRAQGQPYAHLSRLLLNDAGEHTVDTRCSQRYAEKREHRKQPARKSIGGRRTRHDIIHRFEGRHRDVGIEPGDDLPDGPRQGSGVRRTTRYGAANLACV
jgi:hypothetical protein